MVKQLKPLVEEALWYYDYTVREGEDIVPTTVTHEREVNTIKSTLHQHFAEQPVGVYSELSFFHRINKKLRGVVPDIAVVKGVDFDVQISSWLIPERKIGPQVVIEVGSPSTWEIDVKNKPHIYPNYGVREYFFVALDPLELGTSFVQKHAPLLGWRWNLFLRTMKPIVPDQRGRLWSQELASWLVREDQHLHFYDPQGQRWLTETEAAQLQAETERLAKEVAQQRAEGAEQRAEAERQAKETAQRRAEDVEQRAEVERLTRKAAEQRAETAEQRAEALIQKLRELGINPAEL